MTQLFQTVRLPIQFINDISDGQNTKDVFSAVARSMRWLAKCERASITLYEPENNGLRLYAIDGQNVLNTGKLLPVENTMIGEVFSKRKSMLTHDNRTHSWIDTTILAEGGLLSCCDTPIFCGSHDFGTLNLAASPAGFFSEDMFPQIESVARWIGSRLEILEQMRRMRLTAATCSLTGLNNRVALDSHMDQLEEEGRVAEHMFLMIDLDKFKHANDTYGHAAGDYVLKKTAERLRRALPDDAFLARTGGDEFVALIPRTSFELSPDETGQKVRDALRKPIRWEDAVIVVGASIGMASPEADGNASGSSLLQQADIAMYESKVTGGHFLGVRKSSDDDAPALGDDIRTALGKNEFSCWFQPIVDLQQKRIVGVEALSRWERADGQVFGPAKFLEPVRRLGLTHEHAMAQLASLRRLVEALGPRSRPLELAFNASHSELTNKKIVRKFIELTEEMDTSRFRPTLEITEDTDFRDNRAFIHTALDSYRRAGFRIAFDDFGTGRINLSDLSTVNADQIKIARSFVSGIGKSLSCEAMIRALAMLAQDIGLTVVAEGVERQEEIDFLAQIGCFRVQGFKIYRPMPMQRLVELLDEGLPDGLGVNLNPATYAPYRHVAQG